MRKLKKSASIYIVDHDHSYTSSLTKAIDKPSKYNIETFATGEKFIAHLTSLKYRKDDIHIAFLGYHFFDDREHTLMNGIEILEATKVICPDIEVVMLYSSDEASFGAYARNRGACAFVPKSENVFLRINNIIMRIISQKKLEQSKRTFILSMKILIVYIILMLIGIAMYHFITQYL
jgi:DNA-binding NtrC family response regulator